MRCLICHGEATHITPERGGPDWVSIRCGACEDYDVTETAIRRLKALDLDGRRDALQKAKGFARPGVQPMITSACLVTGEGTSE